MSLFNKKNLENGKFNKYGITEKDIKGELKGFPVGVVVRMMEEQDKQGNEPDIEVFQITSYLSADIGGFDWDRTEAGYEFWEKVIGNNDFNLFFDIYPEYEIYN